MSKETYLTGLDIGSSNIRVVQAKTSLQTGRLSLIGAASVPAFGVRKGTVVDVDETVSSISKALERVERMTGLPVSTVSVAINGPHILALESRGVIAVSRADGVIGESDIVRVLDASEAISIPPNREILHVLAKAFSLDGQGGIKDPTGMTGIRLEVDTTIIHAGTPFLKNLYKCIKQTGLAIDKRVVGVLAASSSVLDKQQKELGVLLLDIGSGTTSMAVWEEDSLAFAGVIPLGSGHITNDLAIGLRCRIETAEYIKVTYGTALPESVERDLELDLSEVSPEDQGIALIYESALIIRARLDEIFDIVERELKRIGRDGKLPAGIVLTGGGANLPGLAEYVRARLRLPAIVSSPSTVDSVIDQVRSPEYAVACGLLVWQEQEIAGLSGGGGGFGALLPGPFMLKLKKWFKSFLP